LRSVLDDPSGNLPLRRPGVSALFALSLARLNRRRPEQRRLPLEARSAGEGGGRLSRLEPLFLVAGCILAAATFAAYYSARVITWAVMTDELQTTKLATSIGETGSLVPRIHGSYYGALSQLYPLLIAPFYGLMSPPAAATAAHALNPFLLASAAWPAYLLARSVTGSLAMGYAAAVLTAFTPWLVLTTTLLTENAAYPAFVWAVFLCHRTLVSPSASRDVAALVALLVAFLARTQFFVLALVLPAALLGHELTFGSSDSNAGSWWIRLRAGTRRAIASHPILLSAYVVAGLGAAVLALVGSVGRVVGNYALPFSGDLLPPGIWHSAAVHLDYVVVGCGVLPFVLAASWASTAVVRPERKEGHAFAWLLLVLVPLLTVEVASFDLRFTPNAFVQDRYLFYLAPLFAVAAGAALVQRRDAALRAVVTVAVGGAFAWLAGLAWYDNHLIIFWAAPAAAFHPALVTAAGWLHLSPGLLIRVAVLALAIVAAALCAWPRVARSAVALSSATVVAAFGAFEAGYVFERFAEPAMTRVNSVAEARRDWIDAAVPPGSTVGLVPSPLEQSTYWWEAEFWNKDVTRVLRVDGGPTFTPFPVDDVSVDFTKGRLNGPQPADFLVVSPKEARFHLVEEAARVADVTPLRLVRVARPYRLEWATRGVSADGWTTPNQEAVLRFYGNGRRARRTIVVVLSAPPEAPTPVRFTFKVDGSIRRGSVDPGGARPPIRLAICVPAGGHADVVLIPGGGARVPDGRVLALHFDRLGTSVAGPCGSA
jgi:hypothetical protein